MTITTRYVIPIPSEYRADLRTTERSLGVIRNARSDGQRDYPATDARQLTPTEESIENTIRQKTDQLRGSIRKATQTAAAKFEQLQPPSFDFETEALRIANDLRMRTSGEKENVKRTIEVYADAQQSLKRFRRDNDLWSPATFAKEKHWSFLLIGIFFILEFFVGLSLFRDVVTEPSVLLIWAVLVPVANLVLAFVFGWNGLRFVRHVAPQWRVWGWSSLTLSLVVVVLFSAAVARYRELAGLLTEDSISISVSKLPALTLDNIGLETILLFVGGAAVTLLIGFVEFAGTPYSLCSQYPGYRRATEKADKARDDAAKAIAALRETVEVVFNGHISGPGKDLLEAKKRCKAMREIAVELNAYAEDVATEIRKWTACGHELLNIYRTENKHMRPASSPAPAYFEVYPDMSSLEDVDAERAQVNGTCAAAMNTVSEFESAYRDFTKQLEKLKGEAIDDVTQQYEAAMSNAKAANYDTFADQMATPANSDESQTLRRVA